MPQVQTSPRDRPGAPSSSCSPRRSPRVAATATVTYTTTVTVEGTPVGDQEHFTLEDVVIRDSGAPLSARSSISHVSYAMEVPFSARSVQSDLVTSSKAPLSARSLQNEHPGQLGPSMEQVLSERAINPGKSPRSNVKDGSVPEQGKSGAAGSAGGPAIMKAALGRKTKSFKIDQSVICQGNMLASKGVTGGIRGRAGVLEGQLGAGYRQRWFALVAFDRGGLEQVSKRVELVLLWMATEDKFCQFLTELQESEDVTNTYRLKLSTGGSALRLPAVLGSVKMRSVKKVTETRRLDLPESFYSGIELEVSSKTFLLGVTGQADLSMWLRALRGAQHRMNRMASMMSRASRFLEEEEPDLNKWSQEVGMPRLFHTLWYLLVVFAIVWILSLIFIFNPYLSPCQHGVATYAVEATGECREKDSDELVAGCMSWGKQVENLGSWRSWVSQLQPTGLFDSELTIDGEDQTCFEDIGTWQLFWFWGFVVVEVISKASTLGFSQLNWKVILRGAKTLDEMEPTFPQRSWPEVDVLICHYLEPAEETMQTLSAMLSLDYPAAKLHIYVCDDGYFKSDFSQIDDANGVHWPTIRNNHSLIQAAGDVRQLTEDLMADHAASAEPDANIMTNTISAVGSETVRTVSTDGTGQRQVRKHKRTKEVTPDPSHPERPLPRIDCAVGYVQDTYSIPGLPKVSYVARMKPQQHHSKAGNINNILYNISSKGHYTAIFDNDMQPHPKFLLSTLPLFYESKPEDEESDGEDDRDDVFNQCPYTDDPAYNRIAYVQTPQYFKQNWLMRKRGDPLSHANAAFFDSGLQGMDGYDSAMFVGTNCVWRREALDSIGGLQYGTVSEDYWTGYHAQKRGWDSAYLRKDRQGPAEHRFRLSEGNVPENVAASIAQRKRWHKGSVELFLGAKNTKDAGWEPPPARVPLQPTAGRIKRYRSAHYRLLRAAWLNVFPPLFYTLLVINGLWVNRLWIYLNPLPAYCIMIPFLVLASLAPSIGDITVPSEEILSSLPEYFTYAPVRMLGTLEAFWSKITGAPANWGNTGGVRSGSWNEMPLVIFVLAILVGLVRSLLVFLFFDPEARLSEMIPIWAFAVYQLSIYWHVVRVSIQEFLEWGYDSMSTALVLHWFVVPAVMAATVMMQYKEEADWTCVWTL